MDFHSQHSKLQSNVISQHCVNVGNSLVNDILNAVSQNNVLLKHTDTSGSLSTARWRASYIMQEFTIVMPVEHPPDKDGNSVLILKMLQVLKPQGHLREGAACRDNFT